MQNKPMVTRNKTLCLALAALLSVQISSQPTLAQDNSSGSGGTLLLPLTPKIDSSGLVDDSASIEDEGEKVEDAYRPAPGSPVDNSKVTAGDDDYIAPSDSSWHKRFNLEADIEDDEDSGLDLEVSEDTTLKGTIQIVADDTEYDSEKNTFLGTGNAVCILGGQDSKLEADMILYDQNDETIDARGHVTIIRNGQVTTGKAFKFKVNSDEYLITKPDTEINGATIVARYGKGSNQGLAFKQGTFKLPKPFVFQKNGLFAPIGHLNRMMEKRAHPEAYLPAKANFKFKARKMVYEKYKDNGNLTVFGGKMMFGKFGIPMPKFVATITKDSNDIIMPVAPAIGNNMQVGGVHIGPQFNTLLPNGKGVVSWSPMVQFGGRSLDGLTSDSGIGLSGQASIKTKKLQATIAAGSVNNLLVGDLQYRFNKNLRLQSGINRFMDDGMFGFRRARLAAEVVDTRLTTKIPFLSFAAARTSFGWMQDNPQLVNLNPGFAALFGGNQTRSVMNSGFRLQEQITATSHPIFAVGDDKYGVRTYLFGGLALRGYSSGDTSIIGQIGPIIDVRLNRFNFQAGYNQSAVRGSSPFVFDQFIQGQRSVNVSGDVRINKYLTLGGGLGYNLNQKLAYSKTITAAIGPEDFKVLLTRDMVRGINRLGFDVLYGDPTAFGKLIMKTAPDHGQLGGI